MLDGRGAKGICNCREHRTVEMDASARSQGTDGFQSNLTMSQLKDLQESIAALRSELSLMGSVIRREVHQEIDEFMRTFKLQILESDLVKDENPTSSQGVSDYLSPYLGLGGLTNLVPVPWGAPGVEGMERMESAGREELGNIAEEIRDIESAVESTARSSVGKVESAVESAAGKMESAARSFDSKRVASQGSDLEMPLLPHDKSDGTVVSEDCRASVKRKISTLQKEHAGKNQDFDIEDLYRTTGCWQRWARIGSTFHSLTLVVIVLNVIWIGIDTDINRADVLSDAPMVSQVVNNLFCIYFVWEIIVRYMAFKIKRDCLKDSWFIFDSFLVVFMIWECWVEVLVYQLLEKPPSQGFSLGNMVRVYRLLRLTRLARVARVSNIFPELMILLKGMVAAMRSVAAILCLLGLFIFIFAIVLRQLLADIEADWKSEQFGSVPKSMNTLLIQVIAGVDTDLIHDLKHASVFYYIVFLVFIFLGTLTLMNMLIGVLCEVVSRVSTEEADLKRFKELEHEIGNIVEALDEDESGTITKDEFEDLVHSEAGLMSLDRLGVDIPAFSEFCSLFFQKGSHIALGDFCNLVVQFQGSKAATVKDVVDMRKFITMQLSMHHRRQTKLILNTNQKLETPQPSRVFAINM